MTETSRLVVGTSGATYGLRLLELGLRRRLTEAWKGAPPTPRLDPRSA